MQYANTLVQNGVECVVTVLPLEIVPGFDPEHPPQDNTYGVADDVEIGWAKQPDGSFAPYVAPAQAPTQAQLVVAVQKMLDAAAREKGYDNIVSACSYAGAPNDFQTEGASFLAWRSAVWTCCYAELAKVQAGTRPLPTIAEIMAELPARV